jgi:glycosyltransferase involved in cell wall biosynthesis
MRVLMMLSSIQMGGAERVLVDVLPYMKDLVDIQVCTLNTLKDSPLVEQFEQTGVRRIDLGSRRLIDLGAMRRFAQTLRDEKIDIIHAQDQYTIINTMLVRRFLGVPAVMTRHVLFEPTDTLRESARARMVLFAGRYGGFARLIAVSDAVRERFSELAHVPTNRIETIYNGIDVDRFATRDRRAEKRAELGWDAAAPIIIMVAVLRRGKGHEVLFEALPKLQAAVPNVKIKLVGDGELDATLREGAAQFGDMVEFMGQRMDVPELLGASDVLALPSWAEALPTVLIEAGAASLPVVATRVGGVPEIVTDGETGYIIPPGDSEQLADRLAMLLTQRERSLEMGQSAYQKVRAQFSLEKQAQETIALYERVLAAR